MCSTSINSFETDGAPYTPTQAPRGELLEALPEAEQPLDSTRVALVGIDRKSLRLECGTEDLTRLSEEDANLLLAIPSTQLRYEIFIERKRLDFGRRLLIGCQVFVSVKGISKDLPGVVWYKGELPSNAGTMFGVELIENPGQGTCDGTFRSKRYFNCPPDSGVFVGLDKLKPREDPDPNSPPRSPNRDDFKSWLKDTVIPSFMKGKNEQKFPQDRINKVLEIDQRVVTFIEDYPTRGTVRYIGQEKDASGNLRTIVGLELDERVGHAGTGKRNGRQVFVCKKDFAEFVALETVVPEQDFDENPTETTRKQTLDKQNLIQEQIRKNESCASSMSYRTPGGESVKKARRTNSFGSADVIKAAGESSQTDVSAFLEQQRQILEECKTLSRNRDNNEDVDMQIGFQDDHFKNTPPISTPRDNRPITKWLGISNAESRRQETTRKTSYPDYVSIWKDDFDFETLVGKHEGDRRGDSKQSATSVKHSNLRCSGEVMSPQQILDGTKRLSLETEVVSDCSPRTGEEMNDFLSKEPSEQREIQTTVIN
ncbi:hypothetical protein ACROYT_G012380 [Oculina patagonica]